MDILETKVSYGLSKDGSQIQFFCDVTLGGHVVPETVALQVDWLADDEIIQSETFGLLQQHKGLLKEDKWAVGQTVCTKKHLEYDFAFLYFSINTHSLFAILSVF